MIYQKLDCSEYTLWAMKMVCALEAHEILDSSIQVAIRTQRGPSISQRSSNLENLKMSEGESVKGF